MAPSQQCPQRQCLTYVLTVQEGLGGYGEDGVFPTASTAAAQQALAQSRQRRDERALDKGAQSSGQPAHCLTLGHRVAPSTMPCDADPSAEYILYRGVSSVLALAMQAAGEACNWIMATASRCL